MFSEGYVSLFTTHRGAQSLGKIYHSLGSLFASPSMPDPTSGAARRLDHNDEDLPEGLRTSSRCAEYVVKLVKDPESVPCAPGLSLDMKGRLESVALIIRAAWSNKGSCMSARLYQVLTIPSMSAMECYGSCKDALPSVRLGGK